MFNKLHIAAAAAALAGVLGAAATIAPATAQQQGPACGYWYQSQWIATQCPARAPRGATAISGTIVAVNANVLALQVSPTQVITVNDLPALKRMTTGHVFTGRAVTAYGHWRSGIFMATRLV